MVSEQGEDQVLLAHPIRTVDFVLDGHLHELTYVEVLQL
jgi:hypothetical protein